MAEADGINSEFRCSDAAPAREYSITWPYESQGSKGFAPSRDRQFGPQLIHLPGFFWRGRFAYQESDQQNKMQVNAPIGAGALFAVTVTPMRTRQFTRQPLS